MTGLGTSLLLACLTALLLLSTQLHAIENSTSLTAVLYTLAGMAAMLAVMLAILDRIRTGPIVAYVSFDARRVQESVSSLPVIEGQYRAIPEPGEPWDLDPRSLLLQDKHLALAKLRMELEQELRRIAFRMEINVPGHYTSSLIAKTLVAKSVLPSSVIPGLTEVVKACNQAVHGFDVPHSTAVEVVEIGTDLLNRLRLIAPEVAASDGGIQRMTE
jgi:hypothetical protein